MTGLLNCVTRVRSRWYLAAQSLGDLLAAFQERNEKVVAANQINER